MASGDGSDQQNEAIVADYFAMIADDEAGRPYSKAAIRESSVQQYDDLQARWKRASPGGPALRHIQPSRRQSRSFHDRPIKARMAAGREVIRDVSNGIDGVMLPDTECTVHVAVA